MKGRGGQAGGRRKWASVVGSKKGTESMKVAKSAAGIEQV